MQADKRTSTVATRIEVPLNRVEGDLEVHVELDGDVVTDAWSSGIMYRGLENMLVGRGSLDGLVITPRICGICGTAHLLAAVKALEAICGVEPPPSATRVRNLALMSEHLQSDVRHGILMFMADFVDPAHRAQPLYAEAVARYSPLKGRSVIAAIKESRSILEIVAILGGQWPHSSYMITGGISTKPSCGDLTQCEYLLDRFRQWYEERFLGCSLERWNEVASEAELEAWLDEDERHRASELGFFIRYSRALGLDAIGAGHDAFLSFGQLDLPAGSRVRGRVEGSPSLIPAGFARGREVGEFDQSRIAEHVAYSWFKDYEGGRHPFRGVTDPYATGKEGRKYSWAKAPRYDGEPAEVGPLAEAIVARHPLICDLVARRGSSAFVRELARLIRPAELLPAMTTWLGEIDSREPFYLHTQRPIEGEGAGLSAGSRGALGHWVRLSGGKIEHYQIITPSAWNGSPRDSESVRGPWEEALVGTRIQDPEHPVELGHVVRSFDPCLVCAVHTIRKERGARGG